MMRNHMDMEVVPLQVARRVARLLKHLGLTRAAEQYVRAVRSIKFRRLHL